MYNATVQIVSKDDHKMIFRVIPDFIKMKYLAGQYGALGLKANKDADFSAENPLIKRAYSVSSSILDESGQLIDPDRTNYYEFYIDYVQADEAKKLRLSPRLFGLKDNDRIFLGPKIVGHYTLHGLERQKNLLLISSTTGESPHNSMVRELLYAQTKIHICHIVTSEEGWQSAYQKKHEALMKKFPNYKFFCFDQDRNYANLKYLLNQILTKKEESQSRIGWVLNAENSHVFLCGDPKLIGAPIKLGAWQYEFPDFGLMKDLEKFEFVAATRFKLGNISYESYW